MPSHLYSFSFAPKHDWSRAYAQQTEIRAYVAVVGTGASAVQFVPKIQPLVGRLHLFQPRPSP